MAAFLVCLALGVVFVLVVVTSLKRDIAAFRERFPPISDAEFLARCRPGTDPEVALKVRRIVAEHFAVEYERIHPETRFIADLGAD
ncbi:hypothetical protein [Gemmata sp.]|uniref:hypothetical protein n=1 Tax=Gemmata sp. TaxID=1914242 RepID=UPI003F6F73D8